MRPLIIEAEFELASAITDNAARVRARAVRKASVAQFVDPHRDVRRCDGERIDPAKAPADFGIERVKRIEVRDIRDRSDGAFADFGSRLMNEVRENQGLTYGIYSGMDSFAEEGCFYISTETTTEQVSKVLDAVRAEATKLQTEPIDAE